MSDREKVYQLLDAVPDRILIGHLFKSKNPSCANRRDIRYKPEMI